MVLISPSGRTYTTYPGSRIFFPSCEVATADLPPPQVNLPAAGRGLMMPRRKRIRAAEHARRIMAERALNNR